MLYYIGSYADNKKYKIEDGIGALIAFQKNRDKSGMSGLFAVNAVNVLIAKGYLLLDKKTDAKIYLDKALKANPNNAEAGELSKLPDQK